MAEILLVEDDPALGRGLSINLETESFKVQWARDIRSAKRLLEEQQFSLIILDLNLPDGSGLDLLTSLRGSGSRLPVIILTAQTDEDSVVKGLQCGANDYVKKPFGQRELLARIRTVLREPLVREDQIRYGDLLILLSQRRILYKSIEVDFNRKEFEILKFLVNRAESVVTRDSMLAETDKDGEIMDRTIDSHISHIRSRFKKFEILDIKISSVYGIGYRLEKIRVTDHEDDKS